MRTARWVEQFEGGIEVCSVTFLFRIQLTPSVSLQRLKKILLDDELGICGELEKEMDSLVGTYHDEWSVVVKDPARRRQFRQFVNTVNSPIIHTSSPDAWFRMRVKRM